MVSEKERIIGNNTTSWHQATKGLHRLIFVSSVDAFEV